MTISKTETGYAVNVSNFEKSRLFCKKLGLKYDPPTGSRILLTDLDGKETSIKAANLLYHEKTSPLMLAVNERMDLMNPIDKLFTKVRNVTMVCDVPQSVKDDVSKYVREIHGTRAKVKVVLEQADPPVPTDDTMTNISASQQGFDNKLDNVEKCYLLLKAEPNYLPNETELTIAELTLVINALKAANTSVSELYAEATIARLGRNKEMYGAGGGYELIAKVKNYFKAVFGGNSTFYHEICKFKMTKLAKYVEN